MMIQPAHAATFDRDGWERQRAHDTAYVKAGIEAGSAFATEVGLFAALAFPAAARRSLSLASHLDAWLTWSLRAELLSITERQIPPAPPPPTPDEITAVARRIELLDAQGAAFESAQGGLPAEFQKAIGPMIGMFQAMAADKRADLQAQLDYMQAELERSMPRLAEEGAAGG